MNFYVVHHSDVEFKKNTDGHIDSESHFVVSHVKNYTQEEFGEILDTVIERIVYTGDLFRAIEKSLIEKHGFVPVETTGMDITWKMEQKINKTRG